MSTVPSGSSKTPPTQQPLWRRLLEDHAILLALTALAISTFLLLRQLFHLSGELYHRLAEQGTEIQAHTIEQFRHLYTTDVADRLRGHGVEITHDYRKDDKSIPLPATMTMELGEKLRRDWPGADVRLVSDYPFPSRSKRVLDEFERQALETFRQSDAPKFARFADVDGRASLRLAIPDRMQARCVECHNSHPESPKKDWKIGDVRGILEVIRPLDQEIAQTQDRHNLAMNLLVGAYIAGLGALGLAARWRQQTTRRLRMTEASIRSVVDYAPDGILSFDDALRVQSCNTAAARMFGRAIPDVLGQSIETIVAQESLARIRSYVQQGIDKSQNSTADISVDGHVLNCEAAGRRRTGEQFPMSLSMSMVSSGEHPRFTAIIRDLSEQQRTEAALEQERFLMRTLSDNLPHAIYFKDRESRFLRINKALANSFELPDPDLAIGKTDADFFTDEHAMQSRQDELELMKLGAPMFSREEKETWPDGRETWVSTTKMQMKDDDGQIIGTFGISRDITEIMRARGDLHKAIDVAQSASRAKSEFLANVSHEIRTPMNGIIGMTELALETDLKPEQREYLTMVKTSADSLLHIINDILDFSKIEAGKLELDTDVMLLRDSLGETLRTLSQRADDKGLELAAYVAANVPDAVLGDKSRLRQIVVNLVGNAIKFTEQGEIVVEVTLADGPVVVSDPDATAVLKPPEDMEGQQTPAPPREVDLHFAVRDTGIGIPPGKLEAIFNEFEQADGSTARKYGGTGLGLAISKRLVELMGGRIWVESELGLGSTFHFIVRFGIPEHPQPSAADHAPANLEGLRALVVDDNATNRRILEELLNNWRMVPTLVENGPDALRALDQARTAGEPYALVLLDSHMPEMDGFTLAERIREQPDLLGSTLMMLTSGGQLGDVARCRELGIAAYLIKPITQSDLFDKIMHVVRGIEDATEKSAADSVKTAAPSTRQLRILLAEDNPINQKLMIRLLAKGQHQVTLAYNGIAALQEFDRGTFDVILMDVQMPELGGFETTAEIRRREQPTGQHVPIIAMTAHAMKGDRERCLAAGMDDYISKPIQAAALFAVLDQMARNFDQQAGATQAESTTASSAETSTAGARNIADVINWTSALDSVGNDKELLREIVSVLLDEVPRWLTDLRMAIEIHDSAALKRVGHTAKGSLGQVGADSAYPIAERLEEMGRTADFAHALPTVDELERELTERVCPSLRRYLDSAAG